MLIVILLMMTKKKSKENGTKIIHTTVQLLRLIIKYTGHLDFLPVLIITDYLQATCHGNYGGEIIKIRSDHQNIFLSRDPHNSPQ